MRIEGKGTYTDFDNKSHSVKGVVNFSEDNLRSLKISGRCSFDKISCDDVDIKGDCKGKTITAKNISVSGDFKVDSVEVENVFKIFGSVKIETLKAEEIFIESRSGKIGNVNCKKLKIFHSDDFNSGGVFSKIFGGKSSSAKSSSRVKIKKITAETVELKNCEVEEIKCKDAFIDSNCAIEKLIVEGDCKIAADSKVGEVIRS